MVKFQPKTFRADIADELVYAEVKCPHYGNEYPLMDCMKRVKSAKKRMRQGLRHSMQKCLECKPKELPAINMCSTQHSAKGEGVKRCTVCGVVKTGRGAHCHSCARKEVFRKRRIANGQSGVKAELPPCSICGGKLGRDNTSGRCRTCANQARRGESRI